MAADAAPVGPGADPSKTKRYRLGILFVHGMGEQERGDTITQMGDALTEWLRRWLGNDRFTLFDATLRSRETAATGTASPATSGRANASVILTARENDQDRRDEWLLAESWWADAFRPATLGELVAWAIGVGPWLIASQVVGLQGRLLRPRLGGVERVTGWIVFAILVVVAALVAALITPLAVALLLLSMLPIPVVSEFVRGIARNLAGSFGDLLVFVRSPVRFAAMAERVRQDIEWLDAQCDRIMVVAHSQGSAVAWHAIRRTAQRPPEDRSRVELFLTFGQAFRKLKSLHRLHTRVGGLRQFAFAAWATVSSLLLLVAAIQGAVLVGTFIGAGGDPGAMVEQVPLSVWIVAGSFAVVFGIQWILSRFARANDGKAQELILDDVAEVRAGLAGFRWVDLWASADPAPNGPLFTKPVDGVASYRVRNLASTALDHSAYWSNVTEFVGAVAFAASSLTRAGPLGSEPIPARLRQAAAVREVRVTTLACARVAMAAALIAALIGLRHDLPDIGAGITGVLSKLPLIGGWFSGWGGALAGVVGALAVAVAALAVWWLLTWFWHAVIRTDEARFFARLSQPPRTIWAMAWAAVAAAIPTLAIAWLALTRGDLTFLLWYAVFGGIGLLVVLRLLWTRELRLADPAQPADRPVEPGTPASAGR